MRTVNYRLADGSVTTSYPQAVASGKPFTTFLTEVPRETSITEKRKELLEKYGVVRPVRRKAV
jgi:hypothetical protein